LWALLLLVFWVGCAAMGDRGQTLVPTRHKLRTGSFTLLSNFPMNGDSPAVRCLEALERDLKQHLAFTPQVDDDPVEIYVLDDRNAFTHFLRFYYPELPPRRAFFLAQGQDRVVYTYSSPRLEEDLRHEATHALLRGACGDLALWLDEGLAEYFEGDLTQPDTRVTRTQQIDADRRDGWAPNLERLESLTDIRQMSQRDYREAWAWIDLMLNGPEPGKSLLMSYLGNSARRAETGSLSSRMIRSGLTNGRLLAHLGTVSAPRASSQPAPSSEGSLRLQDQAPTDTAAPEPARSLWRRFRAWMGI
jgi:hypothetical protein